MHELKIKPMARPTIAPNAWFLIFFGIFNKALNVVFIGIILFQT